MGTRIFLVKVNRNILIYGIKVKFLLKIHSAILLFFVYFLFFFEKVNFDRSKTDCFI